MCCGVNILVGPEVVFLKIVRKNYRDNGMQDISITSNPFKGGNIQKILTLSFSISKSRNF